MAHLINFSKTLLLLVLFILSCTSSGAFARRGVSRSTRSSQLAYIAASCKITRYPDLCIRYLSRFANSNIRTQEQLVQAALSVSLYRARLTRSYLLKIAKAMNTKDYQSVQDCTDQINHGVEQLSQSIRELRRLESKAKDIIGGGDYDVFWHINNAESWVSSALTDASICAEAFPRRNMSKLKATIKGKVLNVAQTTSNALALLDRYAARYKAAAAAAKKP